MLIAFAIGTVFYLLLAVAFVGAVHPHDILHNWSNPLPGASALGPYITLTSQAGLGWLATLLVIDAVVSPGGTGLVYLGTSTRLSYGLGRNGYFPKIISYVNARGVPIVSIAVCFVIGVLTFLPFPDWYGLVGLITSATVIMYAMAPLALTGLRKHDPERERKYKLPAAQVLCPVAFVLANIVVYVSGYATLFWLDVFIAVGFVLFGLYQVTQPPDKRAVLNFRSAWWIPLWLGALLVISWLGQYDASTPKVFGLTLLATHRIGNWWDLLVVAAMSLVIYYLATNFTLPGEKVREELAAVEAEANWELDLTLAT